MKTQLTLPSFGSYTESINLHILGICLTMITACSVLKEKSFYQADSLHRQKLNFETNAVIKSNSEALKISATETSSDEEYSVEIVPKGKFKYSTTEGFTGEAASFLISGKAHAQKKQHDSIKISRSDVIRQKTEGSQKTEIRASRKGKEVQSRNYNYLYLGACLIIFVLIYRLRMKII